MSEPKKPTIKGMNLAALGQGAEVQEKAAETEQSGGIRRKARRAKEQDPYTNFPLSIKESQKQKFYDYLDEKGIDSGAAFIRDLMTAVGVFGKPDEVQARQVIKAIEEALNA